MSKVKTAKELGEEIKNGADFIEIEGDLAKKIIRIRATGKVAWAVAFGAIAIAAASILLAPTPAELPAMTANFFAAPAAISILGTSTALAAVSVALGARSVAALTKLRKYKEVSRTDARLVLARR